MTSIANAMANFVGSRETSINTFKALTDRIFSFNQQSNAKLKAISLDYKTKSAALAANMSRLEGEALSLETQIRGIIGKYTQIAVQMDHDEVVDSLRDLLTHF